MPGVVRPRPARQRQPPGGVVADDRVRARDIGGVDAGEAVRRQPLADRVLPVDRAYDLVGGAVDDEGGNDARGGAHRGEGRAALPLGIRAPLPHRLHRRREGAGRAVRQARVHGHRREDVGMGGRQHGCHGAAGRHPDDEHALWVDRPSRRLGHHGPRRAGEERGLARAARLVLGGEPVPAALGVVLAHLLGVRDDEAVAVRLLVEKRARGERRGRLGAPVERDDERGGRRRVEAVGDVDADGSWATAVVVLDHVAGRPRDRRTVGLPGEAKPGQGDRGGRQPCGGTERARPREEGGAGHGREVRRAIGGDGVAFDDVGVGGDTAAFDDRAVGGVQGTPVDELHARTISSDDQYVNQSALRRRPGGTKLR